jgi:hypothetical protein
MAVAVILTDVKFHTKRHRAYFRVNGLADHASEKIIQHIFSIRAFVDPGDSIHLIMVQAQNETVARGQLVRRMQAAKAFMATDMAPIKTVQAENLHKAWTEFKVKNSGAANAMKDARLALIVMLIEGANFSKLMADCALKGDAKSWWSLAASGMSISSALFDIASVPTKSLFGAESWSYQKLKMFGGLLSSAAILVFVVIDSNEAIKADKKNQTGLAFLYQSKVVVGAASLGLTVATTFTYSAPMIGRLTGNAALGSAARAVGARAAAIIGARILFMATGTWITVGLFGIQVFIWVITDDGLQNWCSLCVFGKNRSASDGYRTALQHTEALQKALIEIGISG